MAARTRKLKKRSASSAKPPEGGELGRVTFFVDRSLGSRFVPDALRAAGARVEIHDAHFSLDAEDVDWLSTAGARGWVVLSKVEAIRRRSHEIETLRRANVRAFLLTSAKLNGEQMAMLFSRLALKMARLAVNTSAPFVFAVNSARKFRRLL